MEPKKKKSRKKAWLIGLAAFMALVWLGTMQDPDQMELSLTDPDQPSENAATEPERPAERSTAHQSLDTARQICAIIDNSGAMTAPCEYSIWNASITVITAATPDAAHDFCLAIKETIHANGWFMEPGWRMDVKHPFSNGANIATCRLR